MTFNVGVEKWIIVAVFHKSLILEYIEGFASAVYTQVLNTLSSVLIQGYFEHGWADLVQFG